MKKFYLLILASCFLFPSSAPGAAQDNGVEVKVQRLMLDPYSKTPVVILEAVPDKRMIPIWIDVPEAKAIALELEHVERTRPLTHDLIRNILQGIGATLRRITITDLKNNTYFAVLTLKLKEREFQIDSRPSDAIAVALRMNAPIYATARVMVNAKQPLETDKSGGGLKHMLGIQGQDLTGELAGLLDLDVKQGVLIADVVAGGAAAAAGLRRGDIITKADDLAVRKVADLESSLRTHKATGSRRMTLEVIKKGKPSTVVIDLPS